MKDINQSGRGSCPMNLPNRIQRRRVRGWKMPANTVSVCRPGRFGNPFSVAYRTLAMGMDLIDAQESCVQDFKRCLYNKDEPLDPEKAERFDWMRDNIYRLRGKNLACFCRVGDPCHADVLLEFANKNGEHNVP